MKNFRVDVSEHVTKVSADLPPTRVWSFGVNGTLHRGTGVSTPMVVTVGDKVKITLVNGGSKAMDVKMPHSIDFHSSEVAPNEAFATIAPGAEHSFEFVAKHPGEPVQGQPDRRQARRADPDVRDERRSERVVRLPRDRHGVRPDRGRGNRRPRQPDDRPGPSQGGWVEFTLDREGTYPFVTHAFGDMVKGAAGVLATEKALAAGASH